MGPHMSEMGYRGKIGLILTADSEMEREYYNFCPPGVNLHFTRIALSSNADAVQANTEMAESSDIEQAAEVLSTIKPDCIAMTCTSMSFVRGRGYDQEIAKRIEGRAGIPTTTASTASIKALKKLGLQKLAVAAPYVEDLTARLVVFLEDNGFQVLEAQTLGLEWIGVPSLNAIYGMARQVDQMDAEGIYIACTGMSTSKITVPLEADLGKPVVSAIQATVWDALNLAGVRPNLPGLGCLYASKP
jgi:maleate isomerase